MHPAHHPPSHGHSNSHHMPPMQNPTLSQSINGKMIGMKGGSKYGENNSVRGQGGLDVPIGSTRYAPRSIDKFGNVVSQNQPHHSRGQNIN